MPTDAAVDLKNKGNDAMNAGDLPRAIELYTQGIEADPTYEVLFSNRSAVYMTMKNYQAALDDSNRAITLKPSWGKAYSRKGAALFGLGKYEEAKQAYNEGLKHEPGNDACTKGIEECEAALAPPPSADGAGNMFGQLFGPSAWAKLAMNPQTKAYLDQPDFVQMLKMVQTNPNLASGFLKDPRFQAALGVLLGVDLSAAGGDDGDADMPDAPPMSSSSSSSMPPPKKADPEPVPELSEEEKAIQAAKDEAVAEKEQGNAAYKAKNFEAALAHYNKAIELDPSNLTYKLNKTAVFLEQGLVQECISLCDESIEAGRAARADYATIAKLFARKGNALVKADQLREAIAAYKNAQLEHRTPEVLKKLNETQKLLEERERNAYIDPVKGAEAKALGNEHFNNHRYPEAVKAYTDAIKRDPTNHIYYSNRAGAYAKLAAMPEALKDCDKCLELDPTFAKAHLRKGGIELIMKDYHKAIDSYQAALDINKDDEDAKEGLRNTFAAINRMDNSDFPASDRELIESRARGDPSIRRLAEDPAMQAILQSMNTDPRAAAKHLADPAIANNIMKLRAAGIIKFG